MLRNCWGGGVGWVGDDDVLCTCTHVTCYATAGVVGWGAFGDDDVLCTCTHVTCYAQVSHQNRQYAKTLKKAPKKGLSRVAGTQCIDRAWGVCKAFIPKQIKKKIKQKGRTVQNPLYKTRLFQWVWRRNLVETGVKSPQEFLAKLGLACTWQA